MPDKIKIRDTRKIKDTVNNLTNFLSFYKEYVIPELEKMYS